MVAPHSAVQRPAKILLRALDPRIGECSQLDRIGLARDDRRNHRSTSFAHQLVLALQTPLDDLGAYAIHLSL